MMNVIARVLPLLCLLALPLQAQQERPNILLLMAEDMSSRVGAFGDPVAVTPNLDALAAEGVRYTNVFTAAGVCAPSRAAHILGAHQISTGTQHMRASRGPNGGYFSVPPADMKAYPELLRAAGYYTYTDQKLDYQFSNPFPGSGPFTIWDSEGESEPDWRARAQGQPFFGFRNFIITHESGLFPQLGEKPNSVTNFVMQVMRWWRFDEPVEEVVSPQSVVLPPYYPDTPTVRRTVARQYNNIAYMDAEIGTILEQLEADGLADTTIVIWTTDHGDGLPRGKRDLFDSGIKVPMIIRWPERFRPPGVEAGAVETRLISFIDFAPTLLELAGVPRPDSLQGSSFLSAERRAYIYASRDRIDEVPDRQRAIRDERFKYIRSWYPQQGEGFPLKFRDNINMVREMRAMYEAGELNAAQRAWFEAPGEERLFDLEADPFEVNDVSNDPRYAEDLSRLRTALDARLTEIGDWSDESEEQMAERFQPGGERQVTPPPGLRMADGKLVLEAREPGSSMAYRVDGGDWQLYTGPVSLSSSVDVEAKAVRYGWEESDTVSLVDQAP